MTEPDPLPTKDYSKIERGLSDLYRPVSIDPEFASRFEKKLVEQHQMKARSFWRRFSPRREQAAAAGSIVFFAALLLIFVLVIDSLFRRSSVYPAGPISGNSTNPASTPSSTQTLSPTPASTAAPALNPDAFASILNVFPLFPGAQWTYLDTEYDPAPNDPTQTIQAVYEITDTVIETQIAGSNYIARVQRKVRQVSADSAWSDQSHNPPASGDIVYTLQTNQVTSKNLNNAVILEFEFPLAVGAQWCPALRTRPSSDPAIPTDVPCAYGIGMRIVRSAGPYQSPAGTFPTCFLLDDVSNGGDVYRPD